MDLRRFLNVIYRLYSEGLDTDGKAALDHVLARKWDHEMTAREKKREEAYIKTLESGGMSVQRDLVNKFQRGQQPIQKTAPRMPTLIGARR